jgi:bifunctional non-homologous end joining protein LigD
VPEPTENLKEYREKRDFTKTKEPLGQPAPPKRADEARFVIHKHDATRLHYDVRLEVDGVLKSWAVPQGPSFDPEVKRLAVETEDHPIEYLDFEGYIPKDQYGAGPIILWDKGTYTNIRATKRQPFTMQEAYEQGLIEFRLNGQKLKGAFALVNTKFNGDKKNWLMIKMKDAEADPEYDPVSSYPESVKTGKTVEQVEEEGQQAGLPLPLRTLSQQAIAKLVEAKFPGWLEPMLATPADKPFAREGWIYEPKLDGERCIIFRKGGQVQLVSRNKLLITEQYPELVAALAKQGRGDAVLDGEIVAFEGQRTSFEQMQKRMHISKPNAKLLEDVPVFLYLFDVTYVDGYDTSRLPLTERKKVLAEAVEYADPLRLTDFREGDGVQFFNEACEQGLEGILAKDGNSVYQHRRSSSWLKFKCVREQEAVIGGFTDRKGAARGFGSLLVGYYDDHVFKFAGGVGTGYNDKTFQEIYERLLELETGKNPFAPDDLLPTTDVHWVQPKLVAQVGYSDWTKQDKMRHPRFLGLRADKDAVDVKRETPIVAADVRTPAAPRSAASKDIFHMVEGRKVKLTNVDKLIYPDDGIAKAQVIEYYERIAPSMLPHLKDRPLNMQRFPDGIKAAGFYHKEAPDYFPDYLERVEVKVNEEETQLQAMANNSAALVYLAQYAAITIHPWLSRKQDLRKPDKIVFDLDPSTDDSWDAVKEGARDLRGMLKEMGLPTFVMATGSRGLHVAVPIIPEHDYDTVQLFTKAVCQTMQRRDPKFTIQIRKDKRKGRIFLDYLRNRYGHTSVAPYSLRARAGAPIAAPLDWDELNDPALRPDIFTITNIFERIGPRQDPWKDFFEFKTALPDFDKIQKVLAR